MKYLDIQVNQVANGFIVRGERSREMIEDRMSIPEATHVFENLPNFIDWLRAECSVVKQEK